jgi:hypothetical protein
MDLSFILVSIIIVLSFLYHFINRIFKGKKILKKYLESNNLKWLDISWSNERPYKYNPIRGNALIYSVFLKNGEMKKYIVGSFCKGMLNPVVAIYEE